jgi:hypothetical protein
MSELTEARKRAVKLMEAVDDVVLDPRDSFNYAKLLTELIALANKNEISWSNIIAAKEHYSVHR